MEIKEHILKGDIVKQPVWSKNHSGKFEEGQPDTIIIHYTAGPYKSSVNTLTNPSAKASAHVVIDRDGTITQLIPFDTIAWHAGPSSYKGRTGFNKYSIGIEIVNSGPLTKSGNVYRSWFGSAYNPSDVIEAVHRNHTTPLFWHVYTEEQIQTVFDLCRLLIENYKIQNILGHEEISPSIKTDPGPAFPLDRMRRQLLSDTRHEEVEEKVPENGRVIANSLNIREKPDSNGAKIANPLGMGTKVQILDQNGEWFKVKTEIVGWVSAKYIQSE